MPSTFVLFGLTGKTVPPNGLLMRLLSTVRPTLPALSVALTTATVSGRKIASIGCRSYFNTSWAGSPVGGFFIGYSSLNACSKPFCICVLHIHYPTSVQEARNALHQPRPQPVLLPSGGGFYTRNPGRRPWLRRRVGAHARLRCSGVGGARGDHGGGERVVGEDHQERLAGTVPDRIRQRARRGRRRSSAGTPTPHRTAHPRGERTRRSRATRAGLCPGWTRGSSAHRRHR